MGGIDQKEYCVKDIIVDFVWCLKVYIQSSYIQ